MHITAIDEWSLATAVLGAVLLAEFFISRFWCRYLCPLGAFFALLQRVSPLKIRRNPDVCINCGKCDRACPTGLSPSRHVGLAAGDCIACGMCVDACPRQGALDFALPGRKRIVPVAAVGLSGILIFGLCYGAAKISGHWQTFSSSFQVKNPADKLFGWMTLQKMADETHLSVEQVLEITGLPPDTPVDVPVKRLPGVEDDAVTGALRAYFVKNPAPRSGRGEGKGRNRRLESREEATPSSL